MNKQEIKVLLVEDNLADVRLVREMLTESSNYLFHFNHVLSIEKAEIFISKNHCDVLLLDLTLPDSFGLNSVQSLVAANPDLPIVVLSGTGNEQVAMDAVQIGAQDYLVKGQGATALLVRSLRYAIERKRTEQKMSYLAQYDVLTNLPNRALFYDRLKQAIKRAVRSGDKGALMFLDLDNFKDVNDRLGHHAGDLLLIELANRLEGCIREEDSLSRLGGDEFTIILNGIKDKKNTTHLARKIKAAIKKPILVEGQEIFTSVSIGIVLFSSENDTPENLIKHADMALYVAKDKGRGTYAYYADKMDIRANKRIDMINDLRFALDRNEFVLHYQPQFNLRSGELTGMETLLRWQHPKLGLLAPSKFVHLLEETGLITSVGDWVLYEACKQNYSWQKENLATLRIAVNLSSRQFNQKLLMKCINKSLQDSHLLSKYLQIEITESTLMSNCHESIAILNELREIGIQLSIDDFGTGFSSLNYLRLFPFQALKIDHSFVKEIATHTDVEKIMSAVITLAHGLGMQVVAEGVEFEEQLPFLIENDCDEVQGYLFSRPMSASDCSNWLKKNISSPVSIIQRSKLKPSHSETVEIREKLPIKKQEFA
mgnify:CR=1 FL=1